MIVEKRKHKWEKGERRKLLAMHVILKDEGKSDSITYLTNWMKQKLRDIIE
jgi:hypothetical protein